MSNADVMLTKRELMAKLADRFADIEARFKSILQQSSGLELPAATLSKAGKVSRGENYRGLPYLVLDYPRLLTKAEVLNIRLLFWWGHYFTMSLHLAGAFWEERKATIIRRLATLDLPGHRVQLDGSPWENDIHSSHFRPLNETTGKNEEHLMKAKFIKIVTPLPLNEAESLENFSVNIFINFMSILKK